MGYKIKPFKVVIFPDTSLEKVFKKLEEKSINYEIFGKERHRFLNNNYLFFKNEAYKKLDIERRVQSITKKIDNLNSDEVNLFLDYVDKYFL